MLRLFAADITQYINDVFVYAMKMIRKKHKKPEARIEARKEITRESRESNSGGQGEV